MPPFRWVLPLLTLLALAACSQEPNCLQGILPAVSVHATSATTASPILGATGEVREGSFRESLVDDFGNGNYTAAGNRPGTYAIHLEHEGYATWDTAGVFVAESSNASCPMVLTVEVNASLVPQ